MILEKVMYPANVIGFKSRVLDYNKALKLSNKDFERFYLELMIEYKIKNRLWNLSNPESIPKCGNCHEIIIGLEQLRIYHGINLDSICFRKQWNSERNNYSDPTLRRYLDRVATLKLER